MIKKLILASMMICFSVTTFAAGLSDAYETAKTTVQKAIPNTKTSCPVYADTPFQDIERADLDLVFTFDLIDNPGEARYNVAPLTNYHLQLNMNLSSSFFVYTWAGNRSTEKAKLVDAVYTEKWNSQMLFAGVGVYLTPVFKFHLGGGRIWLQDEDGNEPPLGMAIEYGVGYDFAWGANKIVLSWKMVEAQMSDEDEMTGAELQGSGSYMSMGIGLSIPFMR